MWSPPTGRCGSPCHPFIPGTVISAVVDGAQAQPGAFFTVDREWSGTQQMQVSFTMEARLEERPNGLYCVKRGPCCIRGH